MSHRYRIPQSRDWSGIHPDKSSPIRYIDIFCKLLYVSMYSHSCKLYLIVRATTRPSIACGSDTDIQRKRLVSSRGVVSAAAYSTVILTVRVLMMSTTMRPRLPPTVLGSSTGLSSTIDFFQILKPLSVLCSIPPLFDVCSLWEPYPVSTCSSICNHDQTYILPTRVAW